MKTPFSKLLIFAQKIKPESENGQGLIEYALIILLIVLGVLLILGLIGGQVQSTYQVIVNSLVDAAGS